MANFDLDKWLCLLDVDASSITTSSLHSAWTRSRSQNLRLEVTCRSNPRMAKRSPSCLPEPCTDRKLPREYQNLPYQSISTSYDSYGNAPYQEEFNMTKERIGGFAGSGDTRGYGAYDFPKNHHPESVEHLEVEPFFWT
ncbi:uncharacterized protein CEXT_460811 [Caerostris extrusa]|uniref:Uncharacterized protein n=1 Tax=Caerostris extrusa TaxID=172846 RepID=A0AAV4TQQ2_CAEEX|nr:uncharacterized protein CEXT_460811 [Caerostris extrusa]